MKNGDINSPETTEARKDIIQSKGLLHHIYREWYESIIAALPQSSAPVLELGSGAGFLTEFADRQGVGPIIKSDILSLADLDCVCRAETIPMQSSSLRAIVMVNVFHHIPDCTAFLQEAQRVLQPGGIISMIEPWITPWSRIIYQNLHHEPIDSDCAAWSFPSEGPLSSANSALPWIVFHRDRETFAAENPGLKLLSVKPLMPVSYLASGGFTAPALLPGACYGMLRKLERFCEEKYGMFCSITLEAKPLTES